MSITSGGLRYYLSSLTSSSINSAQDARLRIRRRRARRGGSGPRAGEGVARREDDRLRVRAPSPHTLLGGNNGLHFELASLVVNYFSSGGGGGLP